MELQFVRNQGDELTIGGLALGVGYRIAEESLQGIQIAPVPGDLDGVANGPLYTGRRGAKVLGYLRIEYLGDGVGVPYGPPGGASGQGCLAGYP